MCDEGGIMSNEQTVNHSKYDKYDKLLSLYDIDTVKNKKEILEESLDLATLYKDINIPVYEKYIHADIIHSGDYIIKRIEYNTTEFDIIDEK